MDTKELIRIITEDLDEIQLNDVLRAACRAYESVNQEKEIILMALPKHDQKKREMILQNTYQMIWKHSQP